MPAAGEGNPAGATAGFGLFNLSATFPADLLQIQEPLMIDTIHD
jgi:hypothetical protein